VVLGADSGEYVAEREERIRTGCGVSFTAEGVFGVLIVHVREPKPGRYAHGGRDRPEGLSHFAAWPTGGPAGLGRAVPRQAGLGLCSDVCIDPLPVLPRFR